VVDNLSEKSADNGQAISTSGNNQNTSKVPKLDDRDLNLHRKKFKRPENNLNSPDGV
jgi:hypothetical protein